MREAAFEIALGRADFAPSLGERMAIGLLALLRGIVRRRRAATDLGLLREMDADRLADLGLAPADLAGLDPALDPREATRRLARIAATRSLADRWEKTPAA